MLLIEPVLVGLEVKAVEDMAAEDTVEEDTVEEDTVVVTAAMVVLEETMVVAAMEVVAMEVEEIMVVVAPTKVAVVEVMVAAQVVLMPLPAVAEDSQVATLLTAELAEALVLPVAVVVLLMLGQKEPLVGLASPVATNLAAMITQKAAA